MNDVRIDDFEQQPMEQHVAAAADLLSSYSLVVPIDGWATTDLVTLSNMIDVELQERAYQETHPNGDHS